MPLFTWDFLEAYPNAKVILTVRDPEALWTSLTSLSPFHGSAQRDGNGVTVLRLWVWGLGPPNVSQPLTKRQFLRKYFEHNAKIIHGVPKDQLLVWNVEEEPDWGRLCAFLGVPVPSAPFPKYGTDRLHEF